MQYKDFLFQQLGMLIAIVKQHIRSYLDDIFTLIKVFCQEDIMETVLYFWIITGILDGQSFASSYNHFGSGTNSDRIGFRV
jgi:hypothetical protein